MLTPGRRRRRERLVRPERHAPLAAVVAPYLLTVNIEVSSGFLAGGKTNGLPDLRENAFARLTNDAVSKAPAPIKKCRRSSMDALLRLHTHRRARTYCCPHGPHRHSPPLPVKAGWRGIKPSLDALLDVAVAGSAIKPAAPTADEDHSPLLSRRQVGWPHDPPMARPHGRQHQFRLPSLTCLL